MSNVDNTIISSTPALNTSLEATKHAWYSPTQESVLKQQKRMIGKDIKQANGVPIYKDATGNPIRVTMIGDTREHNTSFKDMEYLGEVSIFMGLGEFREDIE